MHRDSDSEDYVPAGDADSQSSGDEEPDVKRARISSPRAQEETEEEKQRARDALWAQFQASVSVPQPKPSDRETLQCKVKIEKRYRFAGEEVIEVKEVPEDSDEAKKWPRWQPHKESAENTPTSPSQLSAPSHSGADQTAASSSNSTAEPSTTVSKGHAKRRRSRKPKTSLTPLPGSQKSKKLTTLDKSAMDWSAHVQKGEETGLKDELEANRRGGGYLEKVEFLQRVEERKADALDASKMKRRRR